MLLDLHESELANVEVQRPRSVANRDGDLVQALGTHSDPRLLLEGVVVE